MNNPKMKQGLLVAGIALLAVAAVAGWTRDPSPRAMYGQAFQGQPVYAAGDPVYGAQPVATTNCPEAIPVQNVGYAPQALTPEAASAAPQYRTYSRPRVVRVVEQQQPAYVERQRVVERPAPKKRSTAKSAAIVGGSAGVGAAIGAIAGGGKGAAIGALSGGAAGFIYDRLTHNK